MCLKWHGRNEWAAARRLHGESLSVLLLLWFYSGRTEEGDGAWGGVARGWKPRLLEDPRRPLLLVSVKSAGLV